MKQKVFKKISLLFLAFIMGLSVLCLSNVEVKAKTESLSPNDSMTSTVTGSSQTIMIKLSKSGCLTTSVRTNAHVTSYYWYDVDGNELDRSTYNYTNNNLGIFANSYSFYLNKGTYYFTYYSPYSDTGSIEIETSFKSSNESFSEPTYGNNNNIMTADKISANEKYYGVVNQDDSVDNYQFSLSKQEKITLNVTSYMHNCNFYIYDYDGNQLWSDCYGYSNSQTGKYTTSATLTLPKGTYIFSVSRDYYSGNYNFTVNKAVKKFYVKYYKNGGSGSMSNTSVEYGKNKGLRKNEFKKTGYHFTGWTMYRESDGKWLYTNGTTNKWYKEGKQPSGYKKKVYKNCSSVSKLSSVNKDTVRAYAVWKRNTYTVEYKKNGGKGSMSDTTVTYGKSKALRSNSFTRSGYKFEGWTCKRESDNKWYYTNGKKSAWYKEGKQPKGYKKVLYTNKQKISKTSSKNKDTVFMYARWKKK